MRRLLPFEWSRVRVRVGAAASFPAVWKGTEKLSRDSSLASELPCSEVQCSQPHRYRVCVVLCLSFVLLSNQFQFFGSMKSSFVSNRMPTWSWIPMTRSNKPHPIDYGIYPRFDWKIGLDRLLVFRFPFPCPCTIPLTHQLDRSGVRWHCMRRDVFIIQYSILWILSLIVSSSVRSCPNRYSILHTLKGWGESIRFGKEQQRVGEWNTRRIGIRQSSYCRTSVSYFLSNFCSDLPILWLDGEWIIIIQMNHINHTSGNK